MPWCRNELACYNFLYQEGLKTNCLVFSGKFSRGFNRGVKNFTGFLREAKNLAPPYMVAVFGIFDSSSSSENHGGLASCHHILKGKVEKNKKER